MDPGGEGPGQPLSTGWLPWKRPRQKSFKHLYRIVRRAWPAAGDEERQRRAVPGRLDQAVLSDWRCTLFESAAAAELQRWHGTGQRAVDQLSGRRRRRPTVARMPTCDDARARCYWPTSWPAEGLARANHGEVLNAPPPHGVAPAHQLPGHGTQSTVRKPRPSLVHSPLTLESLRPRRGRSPRSPRRARHK